MLSSPNVDTHDNLVITPQLILSSVSKLVNWWDDWWDKQKEVSVFYDMDKSDWVDTEPVLNLLLLSSPATWPPPLWLRRWRRLMLIYAGRGGSRRWWAKNNNNKGCKYVCLWSATRFFSVCCLTPNTVHTLQTKTATHTHTHTYR